MWFIKKTAKDVWNASKKLIDGRTAVEKLVDEIASIEEEIIPISKLNSLANLTYDINAFDQIITIFSQQLKVFNYDLDESHKTLNLLVATSYLIKHGATGFVDQFRECVKVFQKYESLKTIKTYQQEELQQKLDENLQKIKNRAQHIKILLTDKEKLLKQKQLSMLVKQKLKMYGKGKTSLIKIESYSSEDNKKQNPDQEKENEQLSYKLQGLMQKYLWKYVDKLDDTIELASDKIMEQIDKYVVGQQNNNQLRQEQPKQVQKKDNLLQFQELPQKKDKKQETIQQSLI